MENDAREFFLDPAKLEPKTDLYRQDAPSPADAQDIHGTLADRLQKLNQEKRPNCWQRLLRLFRK